MYKKEKKNSYGSEAFKGGINLKRFDTDRLEWLSNDKNKKE